MDEMDEMDSMDRTSKSLRIPLTGYSSLCGGCRIDLVCDRWRLVVSRLARDEAVGRVFFRRLGGRDTSTSIACSFDRQSATLRL